MIQRGRFHKAINELEAKAAEVLQERPEQWDHCEESMSNLRTAIALDSDSDDRDLALNIWRDWWYDKHRSACRKGCVQADQRVAV